MAASAATSGDDDMPVGKDKVQRCCGIEHETDRILGALAHLEHRSKTNMATHLLERAVEQAWDAALRTHGADKVAEALKAQGGK